MPSTDWSWRVPSEEHKHGNNVLLARKRINYNKTWSSLLRPIMCLTRYNLPIQRKQRKTPDWTKRNATETTNLSPILNTRCQVGSSVNPTTQCHWPGLLLLLARWTILNQFNLKISNITTTTSGGDSREARKRVLRKYLAIVLSSSINVFGQTVNV